MCFYSLCTPGAPKLHELKSQPSPCPRNPRNEFESSSRFILGVQNQNPGKTHNILLYNKLRPLLRRLKLKKLRGSCHERGPLRLRPRAKQRPSPGLQNDSFCLADPLKISCDLWGLKYISQF